jgi:hypothetical protein
VTLLVGGEISLIQIEDQLPGGHSSWSVGVNTKTYNAKEEEIENTKIFFQTSSCNSTGMVGNGTDGSTY